MAFPFDGSTVICDSIDIYKYHPAPTVAAGSGTIGIGAVSHTAHARKNCLLATAPAKAGGTSDAAHATYKFRQVPHGSDETAMHVGADDLYIETELCIGHVASIPAGSGLVFMQWLTSAGAVEGNLFLNDAGELQVFVSETIRGTQLLTDTNLVIPNNEVFGLRLRWKRSSGATDGKYQVWIKRSSDSDWVSAVDDTHNVTSTTFPSAYRHVAQMSSGSGNNTYNLTAGMLSIRTSRTAFNSNAVRWDAATRCADITQTAASFVIHARAGLYDDTHCRIAYSTASNLSSPNYTSWALLSSASNGAIIQNATGLSAGKRYYWRVEYGDGSSAAHTGNTKIFHTLPPVGTAGAWLTHRFGCIEGDGYNRPYPAIGKMLDHVALRTQPLLYSLCLGDWMYETGQVVFRGDRYCPETQPEYAARWVETAEDDHIARLIDSTCVMVIVDDHDGGANDYDRTWPTNNVSLYKDSGVAQGAWFDPASSITLQGIYNVGNNVAESWAGGAIINREGAGLWYHSIRYGRTEELVIDTRRHSERDVQMIGATQAAWVASKVAATTAETLIISAPSIMVRTNAVSDSWFVMGNAARQELFDFMGDIEDNAPVNVAVCMFGADRHELGTISRYFERGTVASPTLISSPSHLKYHACVSPIGQIIHDQLTLNDGPKGAQSAAYMDYFYDQTAAGAMVCNTGHQGPVGKISGWLLWQNEIERWQLLRLWAGDSQSSFGLRQMRTRRYSFGSRI